jgi:two-component system sensor histidine kinase CiaH
MFHSARLKLTAWYLVIIMAVSLSFSALIYRGVSLEFQRRLNVIEGRFNVEPPRGWRMQGPVHEYFIEDLSAARTRLLFILLYTNGVILVLSAAAGYFLAGRTLAPIEKAMEEQRRFVADASHELKTPLTALQTSVEVALRNKKLNLKAARKALKESLEETASLNRLVNNLLSLARYQTGNNNFIKEEVDIAELVRAARKKIAPLAKEKGIALKLETKSLKLKANYESLEQLITILLDNAVKYTPKSGRVSVSLRKNKKHLIIKIADTGVGIAKKDLPHIFERFYRVDHSRCKSEVAGFGLGLSMAKKIVELHKGKIDVKSSPGKGSTFTVKFPLKHS